MPLSRPRQRGRFVHPFHFAELVELVLVAGILVPLAVACGGGGAAPPELTGSVRTPPLQVASVELPDEAPAGGGRDFAMRARTDGLLLVYFGYTSCPDICPTTLSDIGKALRSLTPAQRSRVEVAMATVDPERDTGEVITEYLEHFVDGGHALRTEDPEELSAALEAFRAVARRAGSGERYDFEHTAQTYVIDDEGTVVLEWPFPTPGADMAADLDVMLDRIADGEPAVPEAEGEQG